MRNLVPFILISLLNTFNSYAKEGDTLIVRSHDLVDMTWNGNYDRKAFFPTKGKTFQKVLMKYTLGCASTGCSDWDYDVNIYLLKDLGYRDSNVKSYDTISTNPLIVDTVWNVFDAREPFELGRYITPYGTYMARNSLGFNNDWNHTFYYDVSEFVGLFKDSVTIRSNYRGWSSGFSATTDFIFIEGTPPKNVLAVKNIYLRGGGYQSSEEFEKNVTPEKKIFINKRTKHARAKVIVTGHGFDNNTQCAEFCQKSYDLIVNKEKVGSHLMWRNDCGKNPVRPQGGTWLYDRGNWCPGDKVFPEFYDVSSKINPGDTNIFNIDLEAYTWSGNQRPSYNLSTVLFEYGAYNFDLDARVLEVLKPSDRDEFMHWNPSCDRPICIIQNAGRQRITSAVIKYGFEGLEPSYFEYTGDLASMQKDTVSLPIPKWENEDEGVFYVEITLPNKSYQDENLSNNKLISKVKIAPRLEPFRIWLRTNGRVQENKLVILNSNQEEVYQLDNLMPNTMYREDVNLPDGCYTLLLTDEGKDGLDWWVYQNNGITAATGGWMRIQPQSGGGFIENWGGDWGTEIRYSFIYGNYEGEHQTIEPKNLLIFPNPSKDLVKIQIPAIDEKITISIFNSLGQKVKENSNIPSDRAYWHNMHLEDLGSGTFIIKVESATLNETKKIFVE